jgi:hypothetical protein
MCAVLVFASCKKNPIDEAKVAGKSTADFPQITADVFKPMDRGVELSAEEIMGRNAWNLWSEGNEHFWNHAAQDTFGLMDLVKMLDNRKFPRGERFKVLGLVNEPGFRAASRPDELGFWLDEEAEPEPAGIDQTVYGKPSGVLGFRLFPNPDFDEEARKKWNGDRQFEFLQSAWIAKTKFSGVTEESDPLLGNRESIPGCPVTGNFTIPGDGGACTTCHNL